MTVEAFLFQLVRISAVLIAWILTYAVHSTLLLAAAFAVTRVIRANPAYRELIWKAAMLGGIVTATIQLTGAVPVASEVRFNVSRIVEREVWKGAALPEPARLENGQPADVYEARIVSTSERIRFIPVVLVILWALYGALVLTRVAFATKRARIALGPRKEIIDAYVCERFDRVRKKFALKTRVRLTASSERTSPVALGADEICVPERLITELQPDEQESVLAHEIAHLVRRDPVWLLASVTIESILFFQPLNRLARFKIQEEAEFLSDDMAVQSGSTGVTMARCLARVAEWMSSGPEQVLAPAFVERKSSLPVRVRRLLNDQQLGPQNMSRVRRVLLACALPAAVLLVAPGFSAGGNRAWGTPAFRWQGRIEAGQSIEIKGLLGDIRAEPWAGPDVLVTAMRHGRATNPDVQFATIKTDAGVTICTLYPTPAGVDPNQCSAGAAGREFNTKANDVEVDYLVRVPPGVGFAARSATGNVTTEMLSGPVVAQSSAGDVDIKTSSYASGRSLAGNVRIRMGASNWTDTLRITSNSGNITIDLPNEANTEVYAESKLGGVRSDFPLAGKRLTWFQRLKLHGSLGSNAYGRIGQGGRGLEISTVAGNIAIRRSH
ncbi:MAG TPA: M56 family metallopeptidase [Gemmatimonadaceae bacterium]|nr:M56 family metallopeptidase [Gemmatimonadaceae bacterium]